MSQIQKSGIQKQEFQNIEIRKAGTPQFGKTKNSKSGSLNSKHEKNIKSSRQISEQTQMSSDGHERQHSRRSQNQSQALDRSHPDFSNLQTSSEFSAQENTLDTSHSRILDQDVLMQDKALKVHQKTSDSIEYHIKDPTMEKVKDDLATIRSMLEEKLDYLQVHERFKTKPLSHLIFDKLLNFGCSHAIADELVCDIHQSWSEQEAWNAVLNKLQTRLQTSPKILPQHQGNLIFCGTSGSGKTTLLLKVLVSYLQIHSKPSVAVISFDHKIGAQAFLVRFCQLLSIPLLQFDTHSQLDQALEMNEKFDLLLVDSPTQWPFELRWAKQYLHQCQNPEVLYVLSGTTQSECMQQHIEQHRQLFPKIAVITKEDEALNLGHCLSLALEHNFALAGLSSGENISDGFSRLRSFELVDLAQNLFEKQKKPSQSDHLEDISEGIHTNKEFS